jgi:hypothetical protein
MDANPGIYAGQLLPKRAFNERNAARTHGPTLAGSGEMKFEETIIGRDGGTLFTGAGRAFSG